MTSEVGNSMELITPDEKYANEITVYNSTSEIRSPGRLIGEIARGFYEGRELSWRLFLRNLRGLYRQTLLGLFWAFLPPIANTAMWMFLKKTGAFRMEGTNVDALVYILTGMILWEGFIDAFQMPMNALNKNKNMLSRLNFPRESLLAVGLGEVVFNLAIRLLLLIPTFWWFQVELHWTLALAPLAIGGLVLFGMALGLLIMPIGTLYQDVGQFISLALPFWMIVTPIIYVPWTTLPGSLLNWVNPAAPLLIAGRDLLLVGAGSPHLMMGWVFLAATLPLLLLGLVIYRVSLPVLIERMQA
jgi:lipopolysaccharide transport system permease protein